ncbi:hypothetical protein [Phaeobacter sp. S60]|uniref:hypothetical protein n=1 Tax=Phaeobacter sp. S60 TaxID=1569353 RepID=UPI00058BB970|nr:hypothetical protein [Phaeobacter sp. S60]KII16295.1 hypothetical protein OO25_07310 [Phaeobacter sp. S60]
MAEKTTSKDVLTAIFARHKGPEWVRFAEVADGTGAHARRRADAVCMNIWPSKGYAIHGFEIKVSRADFLNEMKDITKAKAVAKYCDYWWLAVPVGLVKAEEVPATWGLMELHKSGLKIKKQAQQAGNPMPPDRSFMAAMLRKSRDADDAYIRSQIDAGTEKLRTDLKREMEYRTTRAAKQAEDNAKWIAEFEAKLGRKFSGYEPPEAMAERVKVAESLTFGAVSRLMQACAITVKEIGDLGHAMSDGRSES